MYHASRVTDTYITSTTPLEDAITPHEFLTSDQNFWPYRHIPQVLTDLITPPVFENFNNPLLQINNNPKFGKIACICFIAFILNGTQSNTENLNRK